MMLVRVWNTTDIQFLHWQYSDVNNVEEERKPLFKVLVVSGFIPDYKSQLKEDWYFYKNHSLVMFGTIKISSIWNLVLLM